MTDSRFVDWNRYIGIEGGRIPPAAFVFGISDVICIESSMICRVLTSFILMRSFNIDCYLLFACHRKIDVTFYI